MRMPRRVRRRLLLPPGWVALGFLLLLGCQVLQPWERQFKLWNMMQVTLPPLKADTSYLHFLRKHVKDKQAIEYNPYTSSRSKNEVITLQKMRPWHDTEFRGVFLADFLNAATTESAIRKIIADTSHAGGVRVRFLPGSTYTNLVKVLDIMRYTDQKKYWLDIRHQPIILYAFTVKPTTIKPPLIFSCGTRDSEVYPPPKKISFQEIVTDFWKKLLALLSQPWQAPALWLALIGSLSLRQLFQLKLSRSDS
ncbi:hypothetical protein [Hymenobacter cheonanensis]|uniref:hypothetical protein n=1 Tax=Hymenobacter sp. CA2-7 TaxID=3063993 RepID=UPI0027142EEF|nr:hypothetical protein [Hymenobacter sp. CA2-7]MDO7883982.1 hypothetical protein [Hymenobacter sp. CA2-7]